MATSFAGIAVDCNDAAAVARFWGSVLVLCATTRGEHGTVVGLADKRGPRRDSDGRRGRRLREATGA